MGGRSLRFWIVRSLCFSIVRLLDRFAFGHFASELLELQNCFVKCSKGLKKQYRWNQTLMISQNGD